ncbi:MAG: VWA domain-containing protein, partial [Actinobacteria bacterium]|nr:VWA domain-containing protein [Actinomycetota bacterium]
MKRFLVASIVAVVLGAWGTALAADDTITIRKINTNDFPTVRLTVATPDKDPDAITVEENGVDVSTEVQSFVEEGEEVDVVLAVDTSGSMVGEPLTAAKTAATTFVEALPDNVRVGLLTFDDSASVVTSITDDHSKVLDAISGLEAVGETALYDGVTRASAMFSDENQRNIVLLSDGGDTVSRSTLGEASSAATEANANIYAVGLEGSEFDEKALQTLAKATDGSYAPAASADLAAVYEGLAKKIEGQYFVFYDSTVPSGDEISLVVSDGTGEDTAIALAPQPVPTATASVQPRTIADEDHLIEGTPGLIIVLAVSFIAFFGLLWLFLVGGAAERKDRELARRMGSGSAATELESEPSSGPISWIPESIVELADEITERRGKTASMEARLERAGWKIRAGEFLAGVIVAAILGLVFGLLLWQKVLFGIILMAVAGAIPLVLLSLRTSRRMTELHAQLPDILSILASSLRAGHSFLQGLDAVGTEIGGPGGQEFSRLTAEIRLGKSVDDALTDLADRVGSDDFKWAMLAVTVQREVGGNLAEVLDT